MNKYLYLPTWLIVKSMWRFLPKTHGWKIRYDKCFSLENWAEHATDLTKEFSIMIWVTGAGAIFLITWLLRSIEHMAR